MVTVPPLMDDTRPEEFTVATAVLLLLQPPPGVAFVNDMEEPAHTVEGPEIVPALGAGLTVTVDITWQLPMPYVIVKEPCTTPVTIPDAEPTVASVVLPLVQEPPVTASDKVTVAAGQTVVEEGVIAKGAGATVTILTAAQPVALV